MVLIYDNLTLISPVSGTLLFGLYFAQVRLCFALTLKEGVGVGDLVLDSVRWGEPWEIDHFRGSFRAFKKGF